MYEQIINSDIQLEIWVNLVQSTLPDILVVNQKTIFGSDFRSVRNVRSEITKCKYFDLESIFKSRIGAKAG
jgi:hypothetical protein